jgi:hypothetical protein
MFMHTVVEIFTFTDIIMHGKRKRNENMSSSHKDRKKGAEGDDYDDELI